MVQQFCRNRLALCAALLPAWCDPRLERLPRTGMSDHRTNADPADHAASGCRTVCVLTGQMRGNCRWSGQFSELFRRPLITQQIGTVCSGKSYRRFTEVRHARFLHCNVHSKFAGALHQKCEYRTEVSGRSTGHISGIRMKFHHAVF